ncbi:MAG TPA: hypothetical protein VKF82_04150 [Candidatus Eremiobacteraceae bacterium]|nr:hypothetical protein [Candidatus Eremiobacteraceae bacterium]
MNKLTLVLLGGIAAVGIASVVSADVSSSASNTQTWTNSGKTITLTGEVLDLSCYTMGQKGMKPVAWPCGLKGQQLGIQTPDGNIVMVMSKSPLYEKLMPYVDQKVTATGTQFYPPSFFGISVEALKPTG